MREARLIETTQVSLSDIDGAVRMRPVNELALEALMCSIKELGHIKDPIDVRRVAHQGNRLVLMAGGHRLEAAKRLGWDSVSAKIWDCNDDQARLLEIDDNLAHAELSTLELAIFMSERKRIYEELHPETRAGVAGAAARWNATELSSFASTIAEKRGITERQVQKIVKAGARLSPEEKTALEQVNPSLKDLLTLAKIHEHETRMDAIKMVVAKESKNISSAVAKLTAPSSDIPVDPIDKMTRVLDDLFARSSKAVKRRFVQNNIDALRMLINDELTQ